MRKMRFGSILLLTLTLALCGCQGERPPVQEPSLVIEHGEILVSDYWKNDPTASNPLPSEVPGAALPYEELGFFKVQTLSEPGEVPPMQCADDLTEAALAVEESGLAHEELRQALCNKLGQVDFSAFRLLVLYDQFKEDHVNEYDLRALVHDGAGGLTCVYERTPFGLTCRCTKTAICARFVLVRRTDYSVEKAQMQCVSLAHKAPLAIEPGEILVSDYWQDPTASNPHPDMVGGTPLCFEEIVYVRILPQQALASLSVADNLEEAAALIRTCLPSAYADTNSVCEPISHVDFSEFRLLMFVEYYYSGSLTHHYTLEGLIHNGEGCLTKMMLDPPLDEGDIMTCDTAYTARFVLVRRADYHVPDESVTTQACFYAPETTEE